MKITQIRENGDTEALSVTDIDLLIEKMKKETKLRPVTGLRQALHFVLPDEPCSLTGKLPRVIPAAAFGPVWPDRRDHRRGPRPAAVALHFCLAVLPGRVLHPCGAARCRRCALPHGHQRGVDAGLSRRAKLRLCAGLRPGCGQHLDGDLRGLGL